MNTSKEQTENIPTNVLKQKKRATNVTILGSKRKWNDTWMMHSPYFIVAAIEIKKMQRSRREPFAPKFHQEIMWVNPVMLTSDIVKTATTIEYQDAVHHT